MATEQEVEATRQELIKIKEQGDGWEADHSQEGKPPQKAPEPEKRTTPEPTADSGQETGEPSKEGKVDWEKKFHDMQASTQKRIDKLVGKLHQLESDSTSKKEERSSKDEEQEFLHNLSADREELTNRLSEVQWKKDEARQDGNRDEYNKLVKEESRIITLQKRLDDKYFEFDRQAKAKEQEKTTERNLQAWGERWTDLMDEFPELVTDDGRLNKESPLFQEAIRLMETNARKPNWATFAGRINAKYDNPNGPTLAIYEASRRISRDKNKSLADATSRNDNSANLKKQALSGGSSSHVSQRDSISDRKIDDLIGNVASQQTSRVNRQSATMEALAAIKKKHNIRTT